MKGTFYGIGVGPGDPEFLTLKAVRILGEVDIVVCPEAKKNVGSVAFNIAEDHMKDGIEKLYMTFPMVHDKDVLEKQWAENAHVIGEKIKAGKNVAFITLGDPTVFSTYMYMVPFLKKEGVDIVTVPGITSFTAVASRMNLPLALGDESFGIVPLMEGCESAEKALDAFDNCVIMKPSHDNEKLARILEDKDLQDKFVLIEKCGTDQERIVHDINELKNGKVPYLSTMIVKRKGVHYE